MLLAVCLPFAAVVVLTTVTLVVRQHALDAREVSVQAQEDRLTLEELRSASQAGHLAALSYRRTGEARWLQEHDRAVAEMSRLPAGLATSLDADLVADIRAAAEEQEARLRALVAPDGQDRRGGLEEAARAGDVRLGAVLTDASREVDERYQSTRRAADDLTRAISAAGLLIAAVGVLGALVAVGFLTRGVAGRLCQLQANAQRLGTDQGLLPGPGGDDEIGMLGRTLESAHATIREKDDLLDLALETGGLVIFELRSDDRITLRGEPALLGVVGLEGSLVTTTPTELRTRLGSGDDDGPVTRLPNGDLRVVTRDGDTRWLEVRSRQQRLGEGQEEGTLVGVVSDVTARVEAQAALEAAKNQAERASTSKDEFLSRMSHELRTPLNAVLGFAQLLAMDDLDEEQRESVDHILRGGRHLLALVNDVLDLARIESGRLSLSVEPTRLRDVVEEAVQLTGPLARQHRVTLTSSCQDDGIHALVDRRRMKQVLLNLLSNGIKYNRPGGRVSVGWSVEGGAVVVTVSDTGIGISGAQPDDLFLPFARADERTAEIEGSGLGLAVSRSLVEAMGGTLALAETGASGSTFKVELPDGGTRVADSAHPEAAGSAVEELRTLGPMSVLHVEDNEANRRLVEELLRVAGTPRPTIATHGRQALTLARRDRPDLILLDRHLPDMLGEDVLRELRASAPTARIPVIVVSADAMARSAAMFRRLGADAFVAKPIDAEELWRTISSVMMQRGGVS